MKKEQPEEEVSQVAPEQQPEAGLWQPGQVPSQVLQWAVEAGEEEEGELESGRHLVVKENQTGISYEEAFCALPGGRAARGDRRPLHTAVLPGADVLEFCRTLLRVKPEGEEIELSLLTGEDVDAQEEQEEHLENLTDSLEGSGLRFDYEVTWGAIHARSVKTDTGWKISLDRGLDIFQPPGENPRALDRVSHEQRRCKPFEVTYLREEQVRFEV